MAQKAQRRGRKAGGKAALVTGASQGIGKATAAALAARGFEVAVADRLRDPGSPFLFLRCDVSREPDVRAAVREAVRRFGRLDALVNNAGIASPGTGPVAKLALAEWNRRLGVNLTGAFLMAKHAAAHLRRARGAIVNISSTRALQSEPGNEAYAASKAGLIGLTQALAVSLGPDVRVNCVSPGWIDVRALKIGTPSRVPPLRRKDHAQHPVGRVGRAEDVAALVAWLVSGEAGFVTGQNFVVDGGMTKKMIYEE